ncbi:MAG: gliding motility-associated C-terminal domain-containing protein, partial [Crocinitomicaceae bacterium]|nr:gliding motility-associated C-terminal domain-containing protein [Crocinitomicaceae bacterium]
DVSICSGETFQVGTANNPEFLYSWNTEVNMNDSTLSDPSITLINSSSAPIVEEYIVTTILSSNPNSCPVQDTVQVTVNPIQETNLNETICQGNVFSLGSTDYAVSGVYQEVFTDVNGCDSSVIVDLTVLQELTSSLTDSICFGGAYDFGGLQYTESGVYTFNTQNSAGCDSTATLNLVVLPDLASVLNESICSGSTYEFGGIQYDVTGSYENVVLNAQGCDSTITLNLTVNPTQEYQYDFSICEDETYEFNGETLTEPGIYNALIQTSEGCDSLVELNLTVHPTFNTSEDFEICEGEEFIFEGQSFSTEGSYNFGFQSEFGCDSLVTINLAVNPTPPAPVVTTNSPVSCFFEPVTIAMQEITGAQYYWYNEYGYNSNLSSNEINLEEAYFSNYLSDNYYAFYILDNCPSDTSVVEIGVEYGFDDFTFPNVITPNEDGVNDELDIGSLIPPCQGFNFKLYNRWGNLVYSQSKDVMTYISFPTTVSGINFSGTTIKNRILDDGVYFYTLALLHPPQMNSFVDLEFPDFNLFTPANKQMNKSGYLHVIR